MTSTLEISRDDFTEEKVCDWVLRHLGHPTIAVELTKEQLIDCIEEALANFNKKFPTVRINHLDVGKCRKFSEMKDLWTEAREQVSAVAGHNSFRFRLEKYGRGLYDVDPGERNLLDWMMQFGFPIPLEYQMFSMALEKYEAYLMWQEEAKRLFSAEFIWRWEEPYLYVANLPLTTSRLFYTYFDDHRLEEVPVIWRPWIKKFTLAEAKSILAQVRGKYQVIPSPNSGVQLNAAELQSQADAERDKLMDELHDAKGDFLAPIAG